MGLTKFTTMISIAFATQKGGPGKSTHCGGLASHLAYRLKKKVCILDADYPQHNLVKYRNTETKRLKTLIKQSKEGSIETEEVSYINRFADQNISPYPIIGCELSGVSQQKTEYEAMGVEYLLLDLPGTVNVPFYWEVVQSCDFVFVPLEQEEKSLQSSLEVLNYLNDAQHEIELISGFWNKVKTSASHSILQGVNGLMDKKNIHHFDTMVEDSVRYQRVGHCTSLFPPDESKATRLYDEMLDSIHKIIKDKQHG